MSNIFEGLCGDHIVSRPVAYGSPLHPVKHIVALARASVLGAAKAIRHSNTTIVLDGTAAQYLEHSQTMELDA